MNAGNANQRRDLAQAVASAVENAPKFHAGDRVRVDYWLDDGKQAGIVHETRPHTPKRGEFGTPSAFEHYVQRSSVTKTFCAEWVEERHLAHADACPMHKDCDAAEGEPHEGEAR